MKGKIAILGGGNIGKAIAGGLLASGKTKPSDIFITRRNTSHLEEFKSQGVQVTSDNALAVSSSEIVILCVQPIQLPGLVKEIKDSINPAVHVISYVIAAYTVADVRELVGDTVPVVRVMPRSRAASALFQLAARRASTRPSRVEAS